MIQVLVSFLFALALTYYLTPFIIIYAKKYNILDAPDGKLKNHKQATPYLGGLAVYIGCITALLLSCPFHQVPSMFLLGCTLALCLGLIDDKYIISPLQKFLGQMVVAGFFLKAGYGLQEDFLPEGSRYFFINKFLSFFWIVSVINAFNLVDVMDGLCTTIAIMATLSLLGFSLFLGTSLVTLLLACFLGALCGFWYYNRPPARIYLGDAGSLFIGSFLAGVPLMMPWTSYNAYCGIITPALIVCIPLLELGTLIIIRWYKCIPFYQGSPDHCALYAQRNGWSRWAILSYVTFYACILGICSVLSVTLMPTFLSAFLALCLVLVLWTPFFCIKKGRNLLNGPFSTLLRF